MLKSEDYRPEGAGRGVEALGGDAQRSLSFLLKVKSERLWAALITQSYELWWKKRGHVGERVPIGT